MLRAKGERGNKPGRCECGNAACRKTLRARAGEGGGQLQHKIRPVVQGPARALELIERRRFSALHEAAAHDDDRIRAAGKRLCTGKVMGMPVVKRVIFRNDADCGLHGIPPRIRICYDYSIKQGRTRKKLQFLLQNCSCPGRRKRYIVL